MKNKKQSYNTLQNLGYMTALAWNTRKTVLLLVGVHAGLEIILSLLELFVVPGILQAVEEAGDVSRLLTRVLFFAVGIILTDAAIAYVKGNIILGRVELRSKLLDKIHQCFCRTSYPNIESQQYLKQAELAARSTRTNSSAAEAIWDTIKDLIKNSICFCIYLVLLAELNPVVVAITAVTAAASYLFSKNINSWGHRHRDQEGEYLHRLEYVVNCSQNRKLAKDARILGMGSWLWEVYEKNMALYQSFLLRRERVYFGADIIDAALTFLRNGIAYAYLIAMAGAGGLTASRFLLYFSAIGGFTAWVTGIFSGVVTLRRQSLDISALREFFTVPEQFRFEDGKALEPKKGKAYALELRDVTFRYPEAEKDTLSHMNLSVAPGEKLAVVGLNGAGKTTMIKLLCGFYDPTEGSVLLDGQDIRQYNRRDYYRHFAAVFQKFSVLAGTIAENVAQQDKDIDMERVKQCVEKAGLREFIESLPGGYETHLDKKMFDDAVDLSGGQMQRLMLARALYKDSPIIILDEPTAALDPIAESDIYQRYNELTEGSTSVYISHRLASTRFCDRIILVENGHIAEEGTHEKLLEKGGRYAELFELQSRYYKEKGECGYENE